MYEWAQGKRVVELMVNWRTHDLSKGVLMVTATLCHQQSVSVDTCPWDVSWSSDRRYTCGLPWWPSGKESHPPVQETQVRSPIWEDPLIAVEQ